jgi:hypothetical protein
MRGRVAGLHHPPDAAFERYAGRREFRPDVGHVTGDAGAEDEAPFADLIEGGELMRQHHRIA